MDESDRRRAVLDALTARLGPRAASTRRGDRDAVVEAGVDTRVLDGAPHSRHLTRYGHLIREPFGRVHWAGTETSTISHGAIDGAVRSGERAAAEVLARQLG